VIERNNMSSDCDVQVHISLLLVIPRKRLFIDVMPGKNPDMNYNLELNIRMY